MPIYEYICEDCQEHFEKIVINKQQEISCPKCSSKKATIQLSVFATAGGRPPSPGAPRRPGRRGLSRRPAGPVPLQTVEVPPALRQPPLLPFSCTGADPLP